VRRARPSVEGMTLIEILLVAVIVALAASGLTFSLGALARTNLKAGADRFASAVRYAYNRAIIQDATVRIHFKLPGGTFSIQEAHHGITMARATEKEAKRDLFSLDKKQAVPSAVDPWAAAQARIRQPNKPSFGASPFSGLTSGDGKELKRFKDVKLPHNVQIVKLLVPHEPEPITEGEGDVHFFPGGRTEHAVVQFSDGREGVYSLEIFPLTGRMKVYAEAYEPRDLQGDAEQDEKSSDTKGSEVEAP
jgi:general secretion pathway protein H